MNIEYFETPVPHIIIRNIFDEEHLSNIWKELELLTDSDRLSPPSESNSAKKFGVFLKKNHAVFLENVYSNPKYSSVFKAFNHTLTADAINEIESKNIVFKWLHGTNNQSFLISYYDNDDRYYPHTDNAVYSVLINFYKQPKAFTGGDLMLGNGDYKIPLENNRLILIPSWATHSVTPVKFKEDCKPLSGMGRYTVSIFHYINNTALNK